VAASKKPRVKKKLPMTRFPKIQKLLQGVKARNQAFLARRPHRSFRQTRRRDYTRSLKLPGYVAFTITVNRALLKNRRTFLLLVAMYAAIMIILGGVTSQDIYSQISDLLNASSSELLNGGLNSLGQAGLLLVSTFATGPGNLTTDQQIYLGFALLLAWLTTVWLHREFMLGRKPKLRDGLYNSGAPVVSTIAIVLILVLQLVPVGIVALMYAGLTSVGLVADGFGAMLFWVFALIIAALVLYWVTSTIIALVVVTLPGMYPLQAMKASGDLVVGRRLRIAYRLGWGQLIVLLAWLLVFVPLILLDSWLKGIWNIFEKVPLLPIAAALASAATIVWLASYVYLLYRKVVEDDAKPA
jgi:hypothetical protein